MNTIISSYSKMRSFTSQKRKFPKISIILFFAFFSSAVLSQVGIGTTDPKATLNLAGNPTDANITDGIIPPTLTLSELQTKTYTTQQEGAVIYVKNTSGTPAGHTINVNAIGLYYLDH